MAVEQFPHRTQTPAVLSYADDGTPPESGTVNYWVMPDTMSERYTVGGGGVTNVNIIVEAPDLVTFFKYALGYTYPRPGVGFAPSALDRHLPLQNPLNEHQYLSDLVTVQNSGAEKASDSPGWPRFGWHVLRATFEDRPYKVMADSSCPPLAGSGATGRNELARYVTRVQRPLYKERLIPHFQVETDDGREIAQAGFVVDPAVEWVYTFWQVPLEALPELAISYAIGRVNETEFDAGSYYGAKSFPAETLLFTGVAGDLVPYRLRDGALYVDIPYSFREKRTGWNNYVRPDGSVLGWRYRNISAGSGGGSGGSGSGAVRRPYLKWPFQQLFQGQ